MEAARVDMNNFVDLSRLATLMTEEKPVAE
jgi:hypothetical protein